MPPIAKPGKKSPNPVDIAVGARVRMRRLMLDMSQEKLGDVLGLSFQQVQKYEKGTNRIGGSRMHQIAGILQVPPAFFFEGLPTAAGQVPDIGGASSPDYVNEFVTSRDGMALIKAFTAIRDRGAIRHRIVKLVEEIAGYEEASGESKAA